MVHIYMLMYNTYTWWTYISIVAIYINCSKLESQKLDYLTFTVPQLKLTSKSALFIWFSEKSIKIGLKDYDAQKPLQHPRPTSLVVKCISESQRSIHTSMSKWNAFSSFFFSYPKLIDIFPNISNINFKNNKQHLSSSYTLTIMTLISSMKNQTVVSIPEQFCIHFKSLVP